MSLITELLTLFFKFLKRHLGKLFLMVFFTLCFLFVLFPFSDLGDLVSSQISQMTRNEVNLNFDKMGLNLFPSPRFAFKQVFVEVQNLPPLTAQDLVISPSLSGLISQKPYGSVQAKGLLKGNVDLNVSSGKKSEKGTDRQKIEMTITNVDLQELRRVASLPVLIKGQLNLNSKALADITLVEQPEINELGLIIKNFELQPTTIDLGGFPLSIPGLKLTQLDLKGRLNDGRFFIESGQIGRDRDEVTGTITGFMSMTLMNFGGSVAPQFGNYELSLDLKMKKSFQDKAALFLLLIDNYKKPIADGFQYRVKLSGTQFGPPPRISPLQ